MKTFLDCIPCLILQALHAVRSTTDDERTHETIVRTALEGIAGMDFRQPPAVMAQAIHRRTREVTGNADPYVEQKRRLNDVALELFPVFSQRIENAANPLELAVRLAIAGNVMDLAVKTNLGEDDVQDAREDRRLSWHTRARHQALHSRVRLDARHASPRMDQDKMITGLEPAIPNLGTAQASSALILKKKTQ